MKYAVGEILRRFFPESQLDPEELLWGILVGAFVLSSLHLITMFLTRWGNRRVTGKALIFSLMLHFAVAVGVVTIAPASSEPRGPAGAEPELKEHRIAIQRVWAETELEARNQKAVNAKIPVWDRVPAAKNIKPSEPKLPELSSEHLEDVSRVVDGAKPPGPNPKELKPTELASLPDSKLPPPTPALEEPPAPKPSTPAPQIDAPPPESSNAQPSAEPRPQVPSHRPRVASSARTAIAGVDRQTTKLDSSKSTRSAASQSPMPAGELSEGAPNPKADMSQRSVTEIPSAETRQKITAPAPAAVPSGEPATGNRQTGSRAARSIVRGITPPTSEGRWQASIDRIRSKNLDSSAQNQKPAAGGEYQPLDARPPSPQLPGATTAPLIVRRSIGVPPTYRLRKLSNRKRNARQFGGNDQSEKAVEASLHWLASVQESDGRWNAKAFGAGQVKTDENGVDRDFAGRDADSGVTALSVLAFLGAGYTHEEGQYADHVERALRWLIGQQQADGNLGQAAGHFAMMYCHAMSTYALAEAYGMQNDPTSNTMLREPLIRGVKYILENQNPDGGWRYVKGQKSDISMFGWQLMALKSAEIAGVNIPVAAKSRMVAFLKERSLGNNGGLAGYREDLPPSPSMTAEALFCKQMLGIKRDNAAAQEAATYLLARLPRREAFNEYYWYYGTLAMYQYGGTGWETWNAAVRDLLLSDQQAGGQFAGSWDPVGPWAKYGGRIYSTALSTLCLEVYYRFLPLYQLGSRSDERTH